MALLLISSLLVDVRGCCGDIAYPHRKTRDNERDRRQTEIRTCLKNNLDRIGHLCYYCDLPSVHLLPTYLDQSLKLHIGIAEHSHP